MFESASIENGYTDLANYFFSIVRNYRDNVIGYLNFLEISNFSTYDFFCWQY